jgi:HEXXH motif-containing protein
VLHRAALWIGLESSLAVTCAEVVGSIHLLAAASGYDISHSEPRWRQRIFVSVPERSDELGGLRLAESVVHEAMHLHLTNHEMAEPLVAEFGQRMKSPWRPEPRSYEGVLHGLFVFTCLASYFHRITSIRDHQEVLARHSKKRFNDIQSEIRNLDISQLCQGLTLRGAALARNWHDLLNSA